MQKNKLFTVICFYPRIQVGAAGKRRKKGAIFFPPQAVKRVTFSPQEVERLKKKASSGKKSNNNIPSQAAWYPQFQTGDRCQKHEHVKSENTVGAACRQGKLSKPWALTSLRPSFFCINFSTRYRCICRI